MPTAGAMIDDKSVPCKNSSVVERLGDELLLFHTGVGTLFELNETGKMVWLFCNGRHSVESIKVEVLRRFGPRNPVDRNVRNFLRRLVKLGLLTLRSSDAKSLQSRKKLARQGLGQVSTKGVGIGPYQPPRVKELWSEKSATSSLFLVEI